MSKLLFKVFIVKTNVQLSWNLNFITQILTETVDENENENEAEEEEEEEDDDCRSDTQPTDHESVSTYSAISELDGVGPPTILQYIKESTRVKRSVPAPKPLSDR